MDLRNTPVGGAHPATSRLCFSSNYKRNDDSWHSESRWHAEIKRTYYTHVLLLVVVQKYRLFRKKNSRGRLDHRRDRDRGAAIFFLKFLFLFFYSARSANFEFETYFTVLLFAVVRLRNPRAFRRGLRNGFTPYRRADILLVGPAILSRRRRTFRKY